MDLPSNKNQINDELVLPSEEQIEDDDSEDRFWCTDPNVLNSEYVQKSRKIVEEISKKLNFSDNANEFAHDFFRYSISAEKFTEKSYAAIAVGCIFRVTKFCNVECNRDELCATYNAINRAAVRYSRNIVRNFFRIPELEWLATQQKLSSCYGKLMLDKEIYLATRKIAKKVVDLNIANLMEPAFVVTACLYMASQALGDRISLRDIIYCDNHRQRIRQKFTAKIEDAVLETYYLMYQKIDQLFPDDTLTIGQIALPVGTGIFKTLHFSFLTMKIQIFPESGLLFYVFLSFPSESSSRPVLICEKLQNPSDTQLLKSQPFEYEMIPAKLYFINTIILPKLNLLENHIAAVYSLHKISSLKFDWNLLKF